MSDNDSTDEIEVSFADVAAEDADESLAREADAVELVEEAGPDPEPGQAESDNDHPAEPPTISSLTSGGPVHDGDDLTI